MKIYLYMFLNLLKNFIINWKFYQIVDTLIDSAINEGICFLYF